MSTHASVLTRRTHEEFHALQYTKSLCVGHKVHLAFSITSYSITEIYLKGSVLLAGNLRASGEMEAMRTGEEE